MKYVEIDFTEQKRFFGALEAAARGGFRKELELFLEGIGVDFLTTIQEEILRLKVVDTSLLLHSFHKGNDNNVWEITDGGLTLEVGSSAEYAGYVNDGHWTNPKGVETRFVPGYWKGDHFVHDRNAKGGMVLKQKWVEGKRYYDSVLHILEKMFPEMVRGKLDEWLEKYF